MRDLTINKDRKLYFILYSKDLGEPILGQTYQDVLCSILKNNSTALEPLVLSDANFKEVGSGIYTLQLLSEQVDQLGEMVISLNGNLIEDLFINIQVKPEVFFATPEIPTCEIFGNIKMITGRHPGRPVEVSARVIKQVASATGNNYLTDAPVKFYTDIDGLFRVRLAIGAVVVLEVPSAGFVRQFIVPNEPSKNIADL